MNDRSEPGLAFSVNVFGAVVASVAGLFLVGVINVALVLTLHRLGVVGAACASVGRLMHFIYGTAAAARDDRHAMWALYARVTLGVSGAAIAVYAGLTSPALVN